MSEYEYEPGTVALVRFLGSGPIVAYRMYDGTWAIPAGTALDSNLSDITPLRVAGPGEVVTKATWEDAEVLAVMYLNEPDRNHAAVLGKIIESIREQTPEPEPEPEPRWTVGEPDARGTYWLRDNGMGTGIRGGSLGLQDIADLLNAAEAES